MFHVKQFKSKARPKKEFTFLSGVTLLSKTPHHPREAIMSTKKTYTPKPIKTVTGIVSFVSEVREYTREDGTKATLINVDLKHGGAYSQLVFTGIIGEAWVKGFDLDSAGNWTNKRPALEGQKNQMVTASGAFEIKCWKNKDGSKTSKPSYNIFSFDDVSLKSLPPLPWESLNNPKAPAPKAKARKKA